MCAKEQRPDPHGPLGPCSRTGSLGGRGGRELPPAGGAGAPPWRLLTPGAPGDSGRLLGARVCLERNEGATVSVPGLRAQVPEGGRGGLGQVPRSRASCVCMCVHAHVHVCLQGPGLLEGAGTCPPPTPWAHIGSETCPLRLWCPDHRTRPWVRRLLWSWPPPCVRARCSGARQLHTHPRRGNRTRAVLPGHRAEVGRGQAEGACGGHGAWQGWGALEAAPGGRGALLQSS